MREDVTVVYSTTKCPQCRAVKRYLTNNEIPYKEVNIEEHPEMGEKLKELGFKNVPVIFPSDENMKPFYGFRPDMLEEL